MLPVNTRADLSAHLADQQLRLLHRHAHARTAEEGAEGREAGLGTGMARSRQPLRPPRACRARLGRDRDARFRNWCTPRSVRSRQCRVQRTTVWIRPPWPSTIPRGVASSGHQQIADMAMSSSGDAVFVQLVRPRQ
jgi:hypothetical protein